MKTAEHAVIKSTVEKRVQNIRKTTSGDYCVGCQCVPLLFPYFLLSFLNDLWFLMFLLFTFWALPSLFSWAQPSPLAIACFACYLLGIALLTHFGHGPSLTFWALPSLLNGHSPLPPGYCLFLLKSFGHSPSHTFWALPSLLIGHSPLPPGYCLFCIKEPIPMNAKC